MPRVWKLGLRASPFERTCAGTKPLECRLDKPKWRRMRVGDIIEFCLEPQRQETVQVMIVGLMRRATFAQLLDYCYEHGYNEPGRDKQEHLNTLHQQYPEKERALYPGVLGIRFELVPR